MVQNRSDFGGVIVRFALSLALLATLALPGAAAAQDDMSVGPRFVLGSNVGNLGLGSEAELRFNDSFALRIGANYVSLDVEQDRPEPDFNFNITPPAAGAMLDYYPFRGVFRLTGGLRYNAESPALVEGPASAVTIGGLPFTPSATRSPGDGRNFVGYAPYGGLGLQSSFWEGRLEFAFDLGVYYQGQTDTAAGATVTAGSDAGAEPNGSDEDTGFLGFYPIIGLSATYRF